MYKQFANLSSKLTNIGINNFNFSSTSAYFNLIKNHRIKVWKAKGKWKFDNIILYVLYLFFFFLILKHQLINQYCDT